MYMLSSLCFSNLVAIVFNAFVNNSLEIDLI
jgi:hypothetical protein